MDMSQSNPSYTTTSRLGRLSGEPCCQPSTSGCEQDSSCCQPDPCACQPVTCCTPVICCTAPCNSNSCSASNPALCAKPADISCGCACAPGMSGALQLLCEAGLAELVDFSRFAFISDHFVLGSSLNCPSASTAPYDNLTGPLSASFDRITPGTCENLAVSGPLYDTVPVCSSESCCAGGPAFPAKEVALCALNAVAFGVAEGDCPAQTEENYQQLKRLLWQALHCSTCASCAPLPTKATPCDAATDGSGRRRTLSVTAGPLLVANAAVLGSVGGVAVLANDADQRIYYICDSAVAFIG